MTDDKSPSRGGNIGRFIGGSIIHHKHRANQAARLANDACNSCLLIKAGDHHRALEMPGHARNLGKIAVLANQK
jgi:hypothetical protein